MKILAYGALGLIGLFAIALCVVIYQENRRIDKESAGE